jgi:hypothetical protein
MAEIFSAKPITVYPLDGRTVAPRQAPCSIKYLCRYPRSEQRDAISRSPAVRIIIAVAMVLALANCATYPPHPAQSIAQPLPGTIRPFVGESMTVGAGVGSGLK